MNARREASRGLAALGRLALLAWIACLAVWLGRSDAWLEAAPEPRARLQAVALEPAPAPPSPPPPPAAPPEPPAAAAPAPAAATPVAITPADRARGDDLLSDAGRFPVLSASYQGMQSFRSYAAAMTALGARFVVVRQRRIVGEIDLARNEMREASLDRPYSPRARDYSGEPALREPARQVRERFGHGAEIRLLVPRSVDAGLFGGIARELARHGDGHGTYRELEGRYERAPDGTLRFRLEAGVRMDGSRVPLDALFDLDALAAGARG